MIGEVKSMTWQQYQVKKLKEKARFKRQYDEKIFKLNNYSKKK